MMAGAASVLSAARCALVGGHSCEGPDAALGFAVTGVSARRLRTHPQPIHRRPLSQRPHPLLTHACC